MTTIKKSVQRVQDALLQYGIQTNIVEFSELTRTSQEAATAIGCELGQIAKTLIFKGKASDKPLCVIASGANRVDEKKIAQIIGEAIERPDADFVEKHTAYAIGGVSPVGFTFEYQTLIDQDLMQYAEIWAAAGTHNAVFKLTLEELVQITNGSVVAVKKDS
ncbi:MAG: YbaK/EbsC family protein [Candidatus Babeliales bacterium]